MENKQYYSKLHEIMETEERKDNMINAVLNSSAIEVSLEQRSQEWLAWRKEGITATEAVVIARGEHFGKTEADLFNEKVGLVQPKVVSNKYIQRGVLYEDSVISFFATNRNVSVKHSGCYQNKVLPFLKCSLDGECNLNGKPTDLEVKCLTEKSFTELLEQGISSETYRKYWVQIQYQMLVTGIRQAFLCCALVDDDGMKKYVEFFISRDENYLRTLLTKVVTFWIKVATYDPSSAPEPEPKSEEVSATTQTQDLDELKALISQKGDLENQLREIQKQIDEKFSIIQKEMNENHLSKIDLGFGTYTKSEAKGSFDYKAFLAKKGVLITPEDENQFRKKSSIRWSFKAA
ncbi:lambda-exonuclease family protein [uncultured Succinivibrio sp.]|uniref:lambda-exonuclease family protein n=1 Tax=uncultured Succinivibrio sp. TaxID=540749 RepID=UPI0025FA66A0|nr:YqaJ viral recombinase family protein [uncultured Succinivibrio sp.]